MKVFERSGKVMGGFLLLSAFAWSGLSQAAPVVVSCPAASADGNRQGQLTTDPVGATCLDYGYGNVGQGNPLQDAFLQGDGELGVSGAANGWVLVSNGDAELGLPKTVEGIDWTGFSRLALFFKVGGGTYCPTGSICTGRDKNSEKLAGLDWFVFELPTLEDSAVFQVISNSVVGGGLSHWGIYGITGEVPNDVPAPGALGLLGLGLAWVGMMRRRKV